MRSPRPLAPRRCYRSPRRRRPLPLLRRLPPQRSPAARPALPYAPPLAYRAPTPPSPSPLTNQGQCVGAALVFPKVFLDSSLSPVISDLVDNSMWSAGALLPLFFLRGSCFNPSRPKTSKNVLFRINQLRNTFFVSHFFLTFMQIDRGDPTFPEAKRPAFRSPFRYEGMPHFCTILVQSKSL
jgi:hypothetical protein